MDKSVNKAAKDSVRQKFDTWYAEHVAEQVDGGLQPINLTGAVMKLIGA